MTWTQINIVVELVGAILSVFGIVFLMLMNLEKEYRKELVWLYFWNGLMLTMDALAGIYKGVLGAPIQFFVFTCFVAQTFLLCSYNDYFGHLIFERMPLSEFEGIHTIFDIPVWHNMIHWTKKLRKQKTIIRILLFWRIVTWTTCVLIIVMLFLNLSFGAFYYVDAANIYHRGSLFAIISAVLAFLLCGNGYIYIRFKDKLEAMDRRFFQIFLCISIASFVISILYYGPATVYFGFTLINISFLFFMFRRVIDKTEKQAKALERSERNLLLSLMKPHFIYNSLNTIYGLCDTDTEKAKKGILAFSNYLRNNIDFLSSEDVIPFSEEMNHVNAYLELQKLRFGDRIHVIYDIQADDFMLPPLTIQPIVENAVKHGIFDKKNGGTIRIHSEEKDDSFEIIVEDNGVGFDIHEYALLEGSHIGIENIRTRLAILFGSHLSIKSIPGEGTTVSIEISKKGK